MTTKAHKLLTGTDLHENKGAAAASDDYVATATDGATVWKKLTAANLATTGNPFGAQLLHVTHQVSSGTDSGAATGATWNTRPLNTSLTNEITSATLSSNQISLPAGTYFAQAWGEGSGGQRQHKLRLRNVTDGATLIVGTSGDNTSGSSPHNGSVSLVGRFTLSGTKTIELQYYPTVGASVGGFGNATISGEVEVYSTVLIWRVA